MKFTSELRDATCQMGSHSDHTSDMMYHISSLSITPTHYITPNEPELQYISVQLNDEIFVFQSSTEIFGTGRTAPSLTVHVAPLGATLTSTTYRYRTYLWLHQETVRSLAVHLRLVMLRQLQQFLPDVH